MFTKRHKLLLDNLNPNTNLNDFGIGELLRQIKNDQCVIFLCELSWSRTTRIELIKLTLP